LPKLLLPIAKGTVAEHHAEAREQKHQRTYHRARYRRDSADPQAATPAGAAKNMATKLGP